jgi:hypothetical protein
MPYATQRSTRPTVDSLGVRHEIDAGLDDAGLPKVGRESESLADSSDHSGTTVYVPLGLRTSVLGRADQDAQNLVRAYHVFNPHAKVTFEAYVVPTEQR